MRTRLSLLIPTLALATALTACGDDGPKKVDFVAKADAACAPGNNAISTTAKPTNAPQVATASGTAASTIDGQVTALRAIKAPAGKEKVQVQGIITAIADVSAPTKALQEAAGKTDDAGMAKAALDMQAKADTAAQSAQAYGLAQCGTQLKFGLGNMFDGVKNVVKATFVSKTETLCRDFDKKTNSIASPGSSAASLAKYIDTTTPLMAKMVADIRALTVAPGDEGTISDLTAAMETLISKFKDIGTAAKANNARLVGGLIDELDVAGTAVNAKFDAYGLTVCGSTGV